MDGVDNVRDAAEELNITKGAVSKLKNKLIAKGRLKSGRNLALADG